MPSPPLACTVRACGLPLARGDRAWACARGHSFDLARAGYVNLLQPQDRKARAPGDSKAAVEARAALQAAGIGAALVHEIVRRAQAMCLPEAAVVVDLGSGTGDALAALAALAAAHAIIGIGIDLSTAAAGHASHRYPTLTWVVANADRRLPITDATVDLVLSLHARRNPAECARVLKPSGVLLMAVPAEDDLAELRTAVLGGDVGHDRVASLVAEHAALFRLRGRATVRERHRLGRAPLLALLGATYRGARTSRAPSVEALADLEVTVASEVCEWSPRADSDRASPADAT
ncbi:MAG: methyltransferase domain-containing protein [Acidobacteriota bacterium]|nr:methyltransferase domain-containing protein [Acidobacteriota bacterium]